MQQPAWFTTALWAPASPFLDDLAIRVLSILAAAMWRRLQSMLSHRFGLMAVIVLVRILYRTRIITAMRSNLCLSILCNLPPHGSCANGQDSYFLSQVCLSYTLVIIIVNLQVFQPLQVLTRCVPSATITNASDTELPLRLCADRACAMDALARKDVLSLFRHVLHQVRHSTSSLGSCQIHARSRNIMHLVVLIPIRHQCPMCPALNATFVVACSNWPRWPGPVWGRVRAPPWRTYWRV